MYPPKLEKSVKVYILNENLCFFIMKPDYELISR